MKKLIALIALITVVIFSPAAFADDSAVSADAGEKILRWGGDAEGGFPYIFPNPKNPDEIIGFEVDIIDALAKEMGRTPVFVNIEWDNIIPGLNRNLFDIGFNGLEVTPEHEESIDFSIPYYKTFLQLGVRRDEKEINSVYDLQGKRAGTLKESYAQIILEEVGDIDVRTYNVEANAYEDLTNGRVDAALFDQPIALYSAGFNPEIKFVGAPIGEITYAAAIRKGDTELLREVNAALVKLRDSGKLREIYDRWNLWTPVMAQTFNDYDPSKVEPSRYDDWAEAHRPHLTIQKRLQRYWSVMPQFGKGAIVTIEVSLLAMLIAIALGLIVAVTRVFAPSWLSRIAAFYVEVVRGTPVLIQLFFIFYGLPSVGIKFSPFWAGAIGLGLNFSAYEAEIYRTGLFAIPRTQWESALALGMTRWQAMREVILPQAVRVVIPPITNDFISLLKDSSLVSIITMVDLTKVYGQVSATFYDYFGPGIIVAILYLVIGLPFVKFSRFTEERLAAMESGGKVDKRENIYRSSTRYNK